MELEEVNPHFSIANMGIDYEFGISAFAIFYGKADISWYQHCEDYGSTSMAIDIDGFYEKDELVEHVISQNTYYNADE